MSLSAPRVGLIGHGYLGSFVYEQLTSRPELGLEVAFVHDGDSARVAHLPGDLVLEDLAAFGDRDPDMVVELAHPDVSRQHGTVFLERADYMPFSLTALADPELEKALKDAAQDRQRRLFIPHGGIIGLDALDEGRDLWEEVGITMRKPVRSLDFAAAPHLEPEGIDGETVLFDGPTREVCPLFPRNVNTHAAVALAGIGFDRTRSVLIADPSLEVSIIELEARGGGVDVSVRRENPMKGVSGVLTLTSVLASMTRTKGAAPGVTIC